MPPHTIPPTPQSQGLGISFSTLSPSPVDGDRTDRQPVSFTGIGALPRPTSGAGPSSQQSSQTPTRGPPRALPPTSTNGAPLYQAPGFSLRPTHTRGGSKGFNTFSALPPHHAQSNPQIASRPPQSSHQRQRSEVKGFEPRDDISVESETQYSHHDDFEQPLRRPSVASNGTTQSKQSSSRRKKSGDFLRKMSLGAEETVGGGAYVPIPEVEEREQQEHAPLEMTRTRSSTLISTIATGAITHNGTSVGGPTPSDTLHTFHPGSFPLQNAPHDRQMPHGGPQSRQQPLARGMSRSKSTPMNLQPVQEVQEKRISDPSTGMHSRNRVLLNAEAGGMMLAFSPGGQYRPGQAIVGPGSTLMQTPASLPGQKTPLAEELAEESLRSRPWSNSTMSQHMQNNSLGHRARSLSDGAAMLARQGTLFHPGSSKQRSSAELNLMLGQPRSRRLSGTRVLPPPDLEAWTMAGGATDEVRLEAAKRKKARVEVDVVLERECVVEGGEVRGRLEVRVNGGKRGEGLRVAGGKVRVVGFEDISASQRHIFYHQPHALSVFDQNENSNEPLPSLFASGPDEEGYRLAAEGTHIIPFRMRIPLGAGAKGSFSTPGGKGPCVRYVVVGSVKLYIPSTMKRSIAHFYRTIVILPYLNPSMVLAPSIDPIESVVEGGLGWSLGGEKGKVEMRIGLGRRTWVAGQRVWCEVGVRNNSNRKIKSVTVALLQTVQTFTPDSALNTDFASRLRRKSANLSKDGMGTPEMDACQTSTVRRKMAEESMDADSTGHGEGRVTGKNWWTGVEPGERDHWDMSLLIPSGLLTIRRTRLIEVTYTLRVTVNGSIYTDLPVNLINFLSIDPPPMPGDGMRSAASVAPQANVAVAHPALPHPQVTRMASDMSLGSSGNPARASSTTLHIDALLQAGRARAEAEAQGTEAAKSNGHSRPQSIGSEYTLPHTRSLADFLAIDPPPLPEMGGQSRRPPAHTMTSYLSDRSDHTHDPSMSEEGGEELTDQQLLEKRQAAGRQKSLALAIGRAEQRARDAMEDLDGSGQGHQPLSPGSASLRDGQYKPDGTPFEHEVYEMGHMPPVPDMPARDQNESRLRVRNTSPVPDDDDDDTIEAGDQTILLDLVRDQLPEIRSSTPLDFTMSDEQGYNYAPEPTGTDFNPASPRPDAGDESLRARYADLDPYAGMNQEQLASQNRSRYDSIAISEVESEVGQVVGATKRNLSVRLPARLVPSDGGDHRMSESNRSTSSLQPEVRHDNAARQPSPLRNVQQLPTDDARSGNSGPRPLPTSPFNRLHDYSQMHDPLGPSPKSQPRDRMPSHISTTGSDRVLAPSHLRRPMSVSSRYDPSQEDSPGLAPSVASDSASSENHLESPPHSVVGMDVTTIPSTEVGGTAKSSISSLGQNWAQGEQSINPQVYLQEQATYSNRRLPDTPGTAPIDTFSTDSHSAPGSPQTTESMLPSVRTKIEQLNTREQALRKFSVTGALSPSSARASMSSAPRGSISIDPRQSVISTTMPLVTSPTSTSGRCTPQAMSPTSPSSAPTYLLSDQSPSKRRSYTAALGPRSGRTMSGESSTMTHSRNPSTHKVGNTTFLTKRSFAHSRHISPVITSLSSSYADSTVTSPTYSYLTPLETQRSPQSKPERTLSISSTSTSATTIEAALMRRPGGPRGPASPAKKGSMTQDARYDVNVLRRAQYGHVTEEDDSEGLL